MTLSRRNLFRQVLPIMAALLSAVVLVSNVLPVSAAAAASQPTAFTLMMGVRRGKGGNLSEYLSYLAIFR